jgi:hypothetical protein
MPGFQVRVTRTLSTLVRSETAESAEAFAREVAESGRVGDHEWETFVSAALLEPGSLTVRHPRVVWANAITSNPTELLARCFTTAEEAFDAAVSEWPYNNTRLSVRWCTADHQEATNPTTRTESRLSTEEATTTPLTRTISREQAEEWQLSYNAPGELHRERLEERRWYSVNLVVFTAPDDGQVWGATYQQGLSEIREDTDPWNDAPMVTLTRYESYKTTATAWRPVSEKTQQAKGCPDLGAPPAVRPTP